VYEAYQPLLRRSVALKVLPLWLSEDPEALSRFQTEAATTAQLDHPNIVPLYSFGCHPRFYFAMRLIRGLSLAELLRRWRTLNDPAVKPTQAFPESGTEVGFEDSTEAPQGREAPERLLVPPPLSLSDEDLSAMKSVCQSFCEDRFRFAARAGEQAAR